MFRYIFLLSVLFCTACTSVPPGEPHPYEDYLNNNQLKLPDPDDFEHCRGYGCSIRDRVSLDQREWEKVTGYFHSVRSAEAERAAISKAIAAFEQVIGPKTGTHGDIAGTFGKTGPFQLDCVDESTNTTMYLAMLEKKKLLKFHVVSAPITRTPATGMKNGKLWLHRTAVIFETASNKPYAVDSWFRDSGQPTDIIDVSAWLDGWDPDSQS
jgi:hypothetical protein